MARQLSPLRSAGWRAFPFVGGRALFGTKKPPAPVVPSLQEIWDAALVKQQAPPPSSRLSRARSVVWRARFGVAPFAALAAVAAAGVTASGLPGEGWAALAVLAATAASLGVVFARSRSGSWFVPSMLAALWACGWVWAAYLGLPELWPWLVVPWLVFAGLWWHRHGFRAPTAVPEVEPAPVVDVGPLAEMRRRWDERVAHEPRGALPRARLENLRTIENGRVADIVLVGGEQTTEGAIQATERIRSAYGLPVGSVIVEPTDVGEGDRARLLLLDRNPTHSIREWAGPSLTVGGGGLIECGTYGDAGRARVQFWEDGSGPVSWLVSGAPGSGKSGFLNLVLAESTHAYYVDRNGVRRPLIVTDIGDGQHGQSLPDWVESPGIRRFATSFEDIVELVHEFREHMADRNRFLRTLGWVDDKGRERRGIGYFDPVIAGLPYRQLVIDELGVVLKEHKELASVLLAIGQGGRKCGMRLLCATQIPSADELGGNINLRSMLGSGNVIVFRTADSYTAGMSFAGGMKVDTSRIPKVAPNGEHMKGCCYVSGPDGRAAMLRMDYVADAFHWASTAPPVELHPVDATTPGPVAQPVPAVEAGPGVLGQEERHRRILAVLAAADGPLPRSEIVQRTQLPIRTVADDLKAMKEARLVRQDVERGPYALPNAA